MSRIQDRREALKKPFPSAIQSVVPVISGKGGVGKSTVTALLALALHKRQKNTAIIDIDIHGPNIPHVFGIPEAVFTTIDEKIVPIHSEEGIQIASVGALGYGSDIAFVWRGPMKIALIRQLIHDVVWNDVDVLFVDTPPGTGDEIMALTEQFEKVAGCVIVTTPQNLACLDAGRSIAYAKKVGLPVLGVVENLSDSASLTVFGQGGGKNLAEQHDVSYLGAIQINPALSRLSIQQVFHDYPDILPDALIKTIYTAGAGSS